MGLNLGGLLSPGKLVKEAVDAVLPEKYDALAGIAGAIVDFKTGNPLGGAQHLAQALKDLPQMLADDKSVKDPRQDPTRGSAGFEPTPPPSRGKGAEGLDWKKVADLFAKLQEFIGKLKNPGGGTQPLPAPPPLPSPPIAWAHAASSAVGSSAGWRSNLPAGPPPTSGGWRGAPSAEAPKPSSSASTKKSTSSASTKKTSSTSASSNSSSASSKKSTSSSSTTKKEATSSSTKSSSEKKASGSAAVDKLNKISNDDLLKMVRTGNIPDEVFDDPKAKLALQERIQHLTEMTKLMTQLMQALHDIRMSVLHNVRA